MAKSVFLPVRASENIKVFDTFTGHASVYWGGSSGASALAGFRSKHNTPEKLFELGSKGKSYRSILTAVQAGKKIVFNDGSVFYCSEDGLSEVDDLLNDTLGFYARKSFSELPGTIASVTEQKLLALKHLEEYIAEYDKLYRDSVDFIRQKFSQSIGSQPTYRYTPPQAGAPALIHFTSGSGGFGPRIGEDSIVLPIVPRPDIIAARADIESFYGSLMDAIQNEVLDDLVKLHPSVSWRDKPFASSSLVNILESYDLDLDPGVLWRSAPIASDNVSGEFTLAEDFPSEPTDEEIISLLVTKASWFINTLNSFDYGKYPPHIRDAIRQFVYMKASRAVSDKLSQTTYYDRAKAAYPNLTKELSEFLKLGFERSESGQYAGNSLLLNRELSEAMVAGEKYSRGTLVLAAPGQCHQFFKLGAVSLFKVMDLEDSMLSSTLTMEKFVPDFIDRIPRVLVALASGALVVGHPGAALFQSLAVTCKRYGFNVVQLQTPPELIQKGILEGRAKKFKDAKAADLLVRVSKIPSKHSVKYWQNLLAINAEEKGKSTTGSGESGNGLVYEDCAVLFCSKLDSIPFNRAYNPSPVTSRLLASDGK